MKRISPTEHIPVDVKILDHRLHENMPGYATAGSAGIDLRACIEHNLVSQPKQCELIPRYRHSFVQPGLCRDDIAAFRPGS
jgi:dUTPase